MYEFVNICRFENTVIKTRYKVLSFEFETKNIWAFRVKPIAVENKGMSNEIDKPETIMTFPKYQSEMLDDEEVQIKLLPPRFLRNFNLGEKPSEAPQNDLWN